MQGLFKLLIKILVLVAILAGGAYFLRGLPVIQALISGVGYVEPSDSVEDIFIRRVTRAVNDHEVTNYAALKAMYETAANLKHEAMMRHAGVGEEGVPLELYLRIKRDEYRTYFDAAYDRDGSGALEKGEWGEKQVFRFNLLDGDKDSTLTYDEMWAGVSEDVEKAFRAADKDSNGFLSEEEFFGGVVRQVSEQKMADRVDSTRDGEVTLEELNSARYLSSQHWMP